LQIVVKAKKHFTPLDFRYLKQWMIMFTIQKKGLNNMGKCFKCGIELNGFEGFIDKNIYCSNCYRETKKEDLKTRNMKCILCKTTIKYTSGEKHLLEKHPQIHKAIQNSYIFMEEFEKAVEEVTDIKSKKIFREEIETIANFIDKTQKGIYDVL
jgi:hypothetical protein